MDSSALLGRHVPEMVIADILLLHQVEVPEPAQRCGRHALETQPALDGWAVEPIRMSDEQVEDRDLEVREIHCFASALAAPNSRLDRPR